MRDPLGKKDVEKKTLVIDSEGSIFEVVGYCGMPTITLRDKEYPHKDVTVGIGCETERSMKRLEIKEEENE